MSKKTTLELLEDNLNKHMAICDFKRKIKSLKAENERLLKAGDEMDAYLKRQDGTTNGMLACREAWLKAKEGRDAK